MNRSAIAELMEIDIPLTNMGEITDDEARDLAISLNLDRRHSTPEQQQAARAGRIVKAAQLAADGHSVRDIAAELSVSKSQVQRDLDAVPRGTRRRKRKPPAARALANVTSLAGSIKTVLRDTGQRAALEAIAAQHGVPFDRGSWPLFEQLRLVLRDLANGCVSV
jgi:transposase